MKPKLLIATNNKGKIKEIRAILQDLDLELVIPADLGLELDVEEDGQTYAENAIKKALAFSNGQRVDLPGRRLRPGSGRAGWRARFALCALCSSSQRH
jgi:hypothetical protein